MTVDEARGLVVKAGKKLVESGLIARTWGNVSCRISAHQFVITPSGRDYLTMTPDEIVTVAISDCSYGGNIQPSTEKGIHAEAYRLYPEITFVIHTHQENASVISASGLGSIKVTDGHPGLGDEVICAAYALPGTKKLRRNVAAALKRSQGKAVIMANHGVLCFGKSDDEAFMVASDLEDACEHFIREQYLKISRQNSFDPGQMRGFALARITGEKAKACGCATTSYGEGERTEKGFRLHAGTGIIDVARDRSDDSLPPEAAIYDAIFKKNKKINYIIQATTPNIAAASAAGIGVRPLLDDFAQLVGTLVKSVERDPGKIASALKCSSAVLIRNHGALCCGSSRGDATAVGMVTEKNSKALIGASLFGRIKPINRLECSLMRFVYLQKYSKQINRNS